MKIRKFLSIILVLALCLTMLPAVSLTASAADTEYSVTVYIIGGDESTDGYMSFGYGNSETKLAYHGQTITLPAGSTGVSIIPQQVDSTINYELAGLYFLTGTSSLPQNTLFSDNTGFAQLPSNLNRTFTMPEGDVEFWAFFRHQDSTYAAPYILTETLPSGTTDAAYSASVSAIGDTTFTWSATGLPAGLSINESTGAISGTPTAAGEHSVTVTATGNTTNAVGSKTFTLSTAAALETHSHPVCGATHSNIGDHSGTCESVSWTAWNGSDMDAAADGRQLTAGSYYLTEDITVDSAIITRGAVSLCLNGHSITLATAVQNSVLIVGDEDSTTSDELNLCDCNSSKGSHTITDPTDAAGKQRTISGGLITGGGGKPSDSDASYGGGVYTNPGAGFNMYGGTIAGNTDRDNRYLQGGGVYASNSGDKSFNLYGGVISNNAANSPGGGVYLHYSDFNMYGGTIADNTSDDDGGGVYAWSGSNLNITGGKISGNAAYTATGGGVYFNDSSFKLSGAPQITGNTSGMNTSPRTDNVYLAAETPPITVNGAMTAGASVGISMASPGIFAEPDGTTVTGLTAYAAYFSDDNTTDDYGIDTDTAGNLALSKIIYPIYIDGIGLNDGEYLESYGTEAVTTKPEGEDGYAYYENGVLTLSDFSFGGFGNSGVVHPGPLKVKLIGDSDLNFSGCAFDLRAQDGNVGALEFVNADTTDGYGVLNVDSDTLVYYDDNVSPGNITIGENAHVFSNAAIHAADLTVEGLLQSGVQLVLSGKLTREGDGQISAPYSTIEWVYGATKPTNFDPADYMDLGDDGEAVDGDGYPLVLGYYLYEGEYYITFFDAELLQSEWTEANVAGYVILVLDPFAVADIYVGGVGLSDGEYLANGADAATTTAPTSGGYAYYENGVLTLSDFSLEGDDYYGVEHEGSLTVKLIGDSQIGLYTCGFVLYSDGSGTPGIEFISEESDAGTLEVSTYHLVDNDSYDAGSNVTIGENATLIVNARLYANQLSVNGTLEVYKYTSPEGKLIRGANGTVRAEFTGDYGVIEWNVGSDAPSSFNAADYLELNGGEAVDKDGNALVLGYYLYEGESEYYIAFFDAGLSQSEWTEANAAGLVILQPKTDAGETDPPVVDPPVVNPPVVNPPVVDPPTESVTIPISGEENSIEVDASVTGSKATVDEVDLSKLDTVVGENVNTGTVTIDFSVLNQDIDTVEIPSDVVKQIAEAVNDPNNDAESLEVVLSDGTSIEFDAVALGEKAAQAGGLDITISIENSQKATLTAAQKNIVGSNTAYDINVTSGGEHISDMGGMVTVHAPYELKSGEVPHGVVVYYVDDSGNKEACETSYDSVRKRVNWKTDHLSLYMIGYDEERAASCPKDETCPMHPFKDLNVNSWYHDGVHYAIENGLMQGTSTTENLFSPNGTTTRAQIVTILHRLEGKPVCGQGKSGTFGDVPDYQWYTEAVEWAAAYGIVEGYGDAQQSFAPNAPITREQLAAILWRYAKYKGYDVSVGESTNILSFEDASKVSEYAVPAMQWAYGAGIIQGVGSADGTVRLDPQGSAIRSQAATVMMRFCENAVT